MKYTMIVNPHAGKKKGMDVAEKVMKNLNSRGKEVEMLISRNPGEVLTLAGKIDLSQCLGVLAVGGDGTLFEVLNGLLKHFENFDLPIGIIPVGTGNSFIKDLAIESVEEALDRILEGKTKSVDVGYFSYDQDSYYFINLLGAGFVSNVAYRARKYKLLGALSYVLGVLEEIVMLKTTHLEMIIDGKSYKREAVFFEICNSRYTGGDMMMGPDAQIDDGLFDIILMNRAGRGKLLSLFPRIFKGTHIHDSVMEVFRGKDISVKTVSPMALTPDGETFGFTPIEVTLYPGKINIFA